MIAKSADAKIRHDPAGAANATALARNMAAQREQLEAANARYETWAAPPQATGREHAAEAAAVIARLVSCVEVGENAVEAAQG